MSLDKELEELRDDFRRQLPDDSWDALSLANRALNERLARESPQVGSTLPDLTLVTPGGEEVLLSALLVAGPVVLNFYRGSWCPFCQLELKAYQGTSELFDRLGVRVLAVSPEHHEPCAGGGCSEDADPSILFLADPHNRAARRLGIVQDISDRIRPLYEAAGLDLGVFNDDDEWALPAPATFVVDEARVVRFAYVNADYTRRVEPADVLTVLRALAPAA